jgi:tetratricopeptide (TPR) repeat protein
VDPFYIRSFTQGKNLYATRDYQEALRKFEIAAFGFANEKELRTKAILFSSLCYFHLKNLQESEKKLKFALQLYEKDGFALLDLESEVSKEIENLLAKFKLKKKEAVSRKQQTVSSRQEAVDSKQAAKKLEQDIKKTPRNSSLYYDLYYIYMEQNNLKKAKKTLEKLVVHNPREVEALSLLGKMLYSDRKFKKCEEYFKKIITISNKTPVEENMVNETGAYLILSSSSQGKSNLTKSRVSNWIERLENKIDILKLTDREKARLQKIFSSFKTKSQKELDFTQ